MHSNKILLQVELAKVIHDIKFYMLYAELLHKVVKFLGLFIFFFFNQTQAFNTCL